MRVHRVPLSLLTAGGLAVAVAVAAAPASAAGWTAAPSVSAINGPATGTAIADDGSTVLYTGVPTSEVLRTRPGSGGAWKVHRLTALGGTGAGAAVAASPGGGVLVARAHTTSPTNRGQAKTVELDARPSADGAWKHISIPSRQSYSSGVAIAWDPTGGWLLVSEREIGTLGTPVHLIAQHLDATGTPDSPEQDIGVGQLGGGADSTLQVDATGRAVLLSAEDSLTARANVHVRPPGGTFGPGTPFGDEHSFFPTMHLRTTSAGRSAVAGAENAGTASMATGAPGAVPGPTVRTVDSATKPGFVQGADASPVGDNLAVTVWSTDRGNDCGSGRECDGRGGALLARTLGPRGLALPVRLARAGVQFPVITPLSGGRALIAWEQLLGAPGHGSTWHTRLVARGGRISPLVAPSGRGRASSDGKAGVVRSAGRWALVTWTSGSGKAERLRVSVRRF